MMKAAIITKHKGTLEIIEVPIPQPQRDEVLVQILACGCCHTDVHAIDGDWGNLQSKLPLCPGHEGVGKVVQIGNDVQNITIGNRVGIPWLYSACGNCEYCISGWETLCCHQQNTGFSVDGTFREYAIAKASHVIPIPESLTPIEAAPILCAGVTSYKSLKESEVMPGQFVTIIGAAGGLGHLAIQYAKAMGMIVIAADVGEEKLSFCKTAGADYVIDSRNNDMSSFINQITEGGSHGVVIFATHASAFKVSQDICRRKGVIVCVAIPSGNFEVSIVDIVLKRITLRGSIVGTREDMREAFKFAERGLVKCLIQVEPFSQVQKVINDLRDGKVVGRVVLNYSKEG